MAAARVPQDGKYEEIKKKMRSFHGNHGKPGKSWNLHENHDF